MIAFVRRRRPRDACFAAKARAGASQIRANADWPTDEKQKRLDCRGWWLLSRDRANNRRGGLPKQLDRVRPCDTLGTELANVVVSLDLIGRDQLQRAVERRRAARCWWS